MILRLGKKEISRESEIKERETKKKRWGKGYQKNWRDKDKYTEKCWGNGRQGKQVCLPLHRKALDYCASQSFSTVVNC